MNNIVIRKIFLCIGAIISIAYIINASVNENLSLALLPIISVFILAIIRKPMLIGYIFILSTVGFLGLINPENFIRVPGVFKFNDLLFLLMTVIYTSSCLRQGLSFPKDKFFRQTSLIVVCFTLMILSQFIVTSLRFDLPIISTIKVGRGFLFILTFFYYVRFFPSHLERKRLLNFVFSVVTVQAIMMLLQTLGIQVTEYTIIRELQSGSSSVTRIYLPAYFLASISFFISTSLLMSKNNEYGYRQLIAISVISLVSIIFSYTRTYWLAIIIGLFILILLSDKNTRTRIISFLSVGMLFLIASIPSQTDIFIIDRFFSIFSEIGSAEGNFIYRFTENPQRIDAFLDNPIFGPGFVHSSYAASLFNFVIDEYGLSESQIERALLLQTNDSGLITLLVSFGVLGVFWVLYQIKSLLHICLDLAHGPNRAIANGILAFVISIWATCATTYGFTYQDGIVALSISLYLIWSLSQDNECQSQHIVRI